MEIVTYRGIVLREFPVGDNDKYIHIFTIQQGVIEALVRGGQKMLSKNSGAIQLYAYSDFSLRHDKGKYYLDSSQPVRLFYKIREDLERL
ncbi:MAG: DNA repair protein RecO, partial [Oscillospiraceae bacterium]|nr:DNA repair protein RecO [Oscillospiraceae bacterium]